MKGFIQAQNDLCEKNLKKKSIIDSVYKPDHKILSPMDNHFFFFFTFSYLLLVFESKILIKSILFKFYHIDQMLI